MRQRPPGSWPASMPPRAPALRPRCARSRTPRPGGEPLRWYGDSAYGTGELREAIQAAGDQAVIKPRPLRAPVTGGFTADDFTVDHQAGTATCPAASPAALPPPG